MRRRSGTHLFRLLPRPFDGTARVLGIASDPGPAECLPFARRALVGDSGQKTQGFFAKLGLTRSYVLVNGFAVALRPSQKTKGMKYSRNTWPFGRPVTHSTMGCWPVARYRRSLRLGMWRTGPTICGQRRILR